MSDGMQSLLLALAAFNAAGILPLLWFVVRFAWRLERRVARVEWHLGIDRRHRGALDTTQ